MPDRPNIIFILSDQQRWDTLGCYGQPLDVTPNLDSLAADGVRFEYAFTNQPLCGPARSIIQTGRYATQTGCFRNHIGLKDEQKTIAHFLSDAGYEVAYVGKWHLASTSGFGPEDADYRFKAIPPRRRGGYKDFWLASDILEFTSHSYDGHMFDANMKKVEFPAGRYRADCLTDFALEYMENCRKTKPFFLFLSFVEPHYQNDHNCYEAPEGSAKKFQNFSVPGDLVDTAGDWKQSYPDYLGCCSAVDKNVGRIRDVLSELGLTDNTAIIYTSDHGSHFRTRNSEYKRSCHDSCIRIPLIIRSPELPAGKVENRLVSLIDMAPTVLDVAGVAVPESMQGKSLGQQLRDSGNSKTEKIFIQISESQIGRAIRTAKWKYSVSAPVIDCQDVPASDTYVEEYLYDLTEDPYEKNNLIRDPAFSNVRENLRQQLLSSIYDVEGNRPVIKPAE